MEKYDVAVIGAGPGGYTAAICSARQGLSVVLIEKEEAGGLCLNWGCIPSKILLRNADLIYRMEKLRGKKLISGEWQVDFPQLISYSRERVEFIRKGLENLILGNKVNIIYGSADFADKNRLRVSATGRQELTIEAENIIIATGSRPKSLPNLPIDGEKIITSKEALALKTLPESIVIVGGGVIGCEMATFFSALGAKVAILEYMPRLLPQPNIDEEISKALLKAFQARGIEVKTSCRVNSCAVNGDTVLLNTENGYSFEPELVIVAVGMSPNTDNLQLQKASVETGKNGFIRVSPNTYRTNADNIYAIGDIVELPEIVHPALAHVAAIEGELVSEIIAKGKSEWSINYAQIPVAIFTDPEIGVCGLTKEEACKTFPDSAEKIVEQSISDNYFGIARALEEPYGLSKIVVDLNSFGKILGAHIIGPSATERIHIWTEAMRAGESALLMAEQVMAHPTFSETSREVLLSLDGRAVYVPLIRQFGGKRKRGNEQ